MKRRSYRIPGLVTLLLLGITAAAYTSSAQFGQESARQQKGSSDYSVNSRWLQLVKEQKLANLS